MALTCYVLLGFVIIIGAIISIGVCVISYTMWPKIVSIAISLAVIIGTFFGCKWFMTTASGRRALADQKSNFNNGIPRVINVYTADGKQLAHYEGKIDIEANNGGYVKFDYKGKRYIYYNCFVETIADIDD